eukprot:COSAG01_NODE_2553_length_7463_cov_57.268468_4_plen_128_part_00
MRSAVRMSGALWLRTCSPPLATMLSMRMLMPVMMMSGAAAAACADAQDDALRASAGLFLMDNWKEAVRIFSTARPQPARRQAAGVEGSRVGRRSAPAAPLALTTATHRASTLCDRGAVTTSCSISDP